MMSIISKLYYRDKQMIRNTKVEIVSLITYLTTSIVNSHIMSVLQEDGYIKTMIILRGTLVLKNVSLITFAATTMLCSILQIKNDLDEYGLMQTVGYTDGQILLMELLKYLIQFIIVFITTFSICQLSVYYLREMGIFNAIYSYFTLIGVTAKTMLVSYIASCVTVGLIIHESVKDE